MSRVGIYGGLRFGAALLAALVGIASAEATEPRHGLSVFGDLKYPPSFRHFGYVDPDAPKGGELRLYGIDSFDTLNPFLLKGVPAQGLGLMFDTLMTRAMDEPDAFYGLVAKSVAIGPDRRFVEFTLDQRARFHDGTPITAADIVFTFETLVAKGHPQYRILFRDVATAEATAADRVRFSFKEGEHRDLPTQLASLPVLSRAYYVGVEFDRTTLTPPLASGPYKLRRVDPGRTIVYERVADYWGRDLAVNRGRYNFDLLRWEYFRDRNIAFEAIFSGAYDYREEFTARAWAMQYDKPPVKQGLVVRETLPDETPSGVQAFFFNQRRDKFKDRRVRAALNFAFDYEWMNKTIFHGLYERTNSMYENSELAAKAPPSADELALLTPFRGLVPEEVFMQPFKSPVSDGSGNHRDGLRRAATLLKEAGWTVQDKTLVNAKNEPLEIEFLIFESSFQRVIGPYVQNLDRLGIKARIRIVDVANFKYRTDHFDFDVIVQRYVQPLTPGIEQRNYFASDYADVPGSLNVAGIKDKAVDALIEHIVTASTRPELVTATRALDRVLMWSHVAVPQWYKGAHNIAYWNKFGRPATQPKYDLGVVDTWWFDRDKAALIEAGKAPPAPQSAPKAR